MSLRIKLSFSIFTLCTALVINAQSVAIQSPDQKIKTIFKIDITRGYAAVYSVTNQQKVILTESPLGLEFEDQKIPGKNIGIISVKRKSIRGAWKPVYGERNIYPDNYNEAVIRLKEAVSSGRTLSLTFRVYNEGVAFKYTVHTSTPLVISRELTGFRFDKDYTSWIAPFAQAEYQKRSVSKTGKGCERPYVIKMDKGKYIAIGEAALISNPRMKFDRSEKDSLLILAALSGRASYDSSFSTPWRYIMIADSPGRLLENNYFILNLNAPNAVKDASWIKPGKVIRESTLTTKGAINCIDFAAAHGLQYIEFDAGWYGKEDSDTSDATRVSVDPARSKGPLDLKKVIAYGKKNNVGVILYVNRRALERQLDTLLPLYQSWGVKGLKFGFVQVGPQRWTSWLHEAIRKAAKYKMVVDIHDEYRPTGYSRTYPNLLTQEGVRGDEESPYTEQSITSLFTRSIAGAADNTNCYFTNRVNKMGSHVAQLAKSVCIYSPLQFLFWYDRPTPDSLKSGKEGEIQEVPELAWFKALPTVWDDTKVLEGDMEDFATIARRSGSDWFIGSLNGVNSRTLNLNLNFLDKKKKYKATIYTDDITVDTYTKVRKAVMKVDYNSRLSFNIESRKGVAIHISPQ